MGLWVCIWILSFVGGLVFGHIRYRKDKVIDASPDVEDNILYKTKTFSDEQKEAWWEAVNYREHLNAYASGEPDGCMYYYKEHRYVKTPQYGWVYLNPMLPELEQEFAYLIKQYEERGKRFRTYKKGE